MGDFEAYYAKSGYDYDGEEETELSMKVGDVLWVEESADGGWVLASHSPPRENDEPGWLPENYLIRLSDEEVAEHEKIIAASLPQPTEDVGEEAALVDPNELADTVASLDIDAEKKVEPEAKKERRRSQIITAESLAAATAADAKADSNDNSEAPSDTTAGATEAAPVDDDANVCGVCNKPVSGTFVMAQDKHFCTACFVCTECSCDLGGQAFVQHEGSFYCETCYSKNFNPKCGRCEETIIGSYISALDKSWHADCFVCTVCGGAFTTGQFHHHDGKPYCETHFKQVGSKCARCQQLITGQVFTAGDKRFHAECFLCASGEHSIAQGQSFHIRDNKVYCADHFKQLFLKTCEECKEVINGKYIQLMGKFFHMECWKCTACKVQIDQKTCAQVGTKFYCRPCANTERETMAKAKIEQKRDLANGKTTFSIAELKDTASLPTYVDTKAKEKYLADDEFQEIFGMDKTAFDRLPKWKKKKAKTNAGLF